MYNKRRDYYYDMMRGLSILMVIGIHTYTNPAFCNFIGFVEVIIRQIINCAVPIFFAISGYFIAKKEFSSFRDILQFWMKQIPKVYIPTLIWSIPFLVIELVKGNNIYSSIFFWVICGLGPFYFIATIIQFYLIIPFIKRLNRFILLIVSIIGSLISAYYISWGGFSVMPIIVYAGPFYVWGAFYALGIVLSQYNNTFRIGKGLCLSLILTGLILQIIELHIMNVNGIFSVGLKMSSVIFSYLTIVALFSLRREQNIKKSNILVRMGDMSFTIYLIHSYYALIIGRLSSDYDMWLVNWSIVIIASVLTLVTIKKIIPQKYHYYLAIS